MDGYGERGRAHVPVIGMVKNDGELSAFRGLLGVLWVWCLFLFDGLVVVVVVISVVVVGVGVGMGVHLHLHLALDLARRGLKLKDDVGGGVEARGAIWGEKRVWRARWDWDILLSLALLSASGSEALFLESKQRQRRHLFLFVCCLCFVHRPARRARGGGASEAQGRLASGVGRRAPRVERVSKRVGRAAQRGQTQQGTWVGGWVSG